MAFQNKFEVSGKAEGVDQKWVNFKVAITDAGVKKNTKSRKENKEKWMTENILTSCHGKKKASKKNNREKV